MERITYKTLKNLCSSNEEKVNKAFDLIFNKYRFLIYYVSLEILKDKEEAKDIVEGTFLKMYERRRYFMNERGVKYFLLRTAKNDSINRLKEINIHEQYSDDINGVKDKDDYSSYYDKFKKLVDEEEFDYLIKHLVYGFTFREIALGKRVTTSVVSSKYRRGLKKLKDYYGGKDHEQH